MKFSLCPQLSVSEGHEKRRGKAGGIRTLDEHLSRKNLLHTTVGDSSYKQGSPGITPAGQTLYNGIDRTG